MIMTYDDELNAKGLLCPLPVLKAKKRLKMLSLGQVLKLVATDPAAIIDVPHFCNEQGHDLVQVEECVSDDQVTNYYIRRG